MEKFKIDIILPSYNGSKFIKELLNSMLKQNYKEFKILIRDDNSNDGTQNILRNYKSRFPDKIEIIEDELGNLGVVNNVFEILKYSTGKYIMLCDQDDIWFENKIFSLLNFIRKKEIDNHNLPILVHSEAVITDEYLNVLDSTFSHYSRLNRKHNNLCNLLQKNIVQGSSTIFNRFLLDKMWKIMEESNNKNYIKKIAYHDLWMAILASISGKIYFLNLPLMYYRQHGKNIVGAYDNIESFKKLLKLNSDDWNKFKYHNYLTVNRYLCKEIIRIYKDELNDKQIMIIRHFMDRSSDMKEFFKLKLYKYYNLEEIILMLVFHIN